MKRSLWPTRDPVKDYFPLPKEIFSLGLSAAEIAIYAFLLFCEDRQTFQCWPSYRKIGDAVGLSPNTIRDGYDEGWLQTQWQPAVHNPTDSSGAPAGL